MNCVRWQRLVALYVGDDLDRSRTAKVELHIAACPSCRDLEHDLRQDRLRLLDLDAAAMNGFELGSVRGAVMAKIENRQKRSPVISQPRLLSALAMAVVVIALALVMRRSSGPDAPHTVSREIPSPSPGLATVPEPQDAPLPQPTPDSVRSVPNSADTRLARVETLPAGRSTSSPPSVPAEPMTIKILTDDPEVVIYWIVDPKGDKEHV